MKILLLVFYLSAILVIGSLSLNAQELPDEKIQQLLQSGNEKQAIILLNKYIKDNPDSIKAYIKLTNIYLAISNPYSRKQAERLLLSGLQHQPHNVQILTQLAKVKDEQGLNDIAKKWLEKAIRGDQTNQKIIEQLLEYYIQYNYKKKIEDLSSSVDFILKKNPKNPQCYLIMGKLETALRNYGTAVTALKKGLEFSPENQEILRALWFTYLSTGLRTDFTETYYHWLAVEKDPIILNQEYQLASLCMEKEDTQQFKNVPFPEKSSFLITYWRKHDSFPITIENERLVDHERRVFYAKKYFFSEQGEFGFDDRGKTYIRWGEPEEKIIVPVYSEPVLYGGVKSWWENASWYYPSLGYYLCFDFINVSGYFQEVDNALSAFRSYGGGNMMTQKMAARKFYEFRGNKLGGIYAMMGIEPEPFSRVTEIANEKRIAKETINPRYDVKLDIPQLEFACRTPQFRGDSGRTKLEIAYGVPLKQLKKQPKVDDSTIAFIFQTDFVLIDSIGQRNLHSRGQQQYDCPIQQDYSHIKYVNEEKKTVAPGSYTMCFQILELSKKRGDFKVAPLSVRNYQGTHLMMSDLKFSNVIEYIGMDSKTGLEQLSVMPYPFSEVSRNQPIYVYFEIYNLTLTPDQKSKYEISLKMEREAKKGEFVSALLQSFGKIFTKGKPQQIETIYQRQGNNQTAIESLELDLSELNAGHSRLTVTVKDLNIGNQVGNNIEFDLQ